MAHEQPGGGWTRRQLLSMAAGAAALSLPSTRLMDQGGTARLGTRPTAPVDPVGPGLRRLGLAGERDGAWLVPAGYRAERPAALLVALHGAGSTADSPIAFLRPYAERDGFVLLGIDARDYTWDAIRGSWGGDVRFIDRALSEVFSRCAIDPGRIAINGFSDGASYALGLALANGDLFGRVVAFSPGFIPEADSPPAGKPRFFVSHGRTDRVLPIDATSRRIVPVLEQAGYRVAYREFDGGHAIPPDIADAAMAWMADAKG